MMQTRRAKIVLATVVVAVVFGVIITASRSERSRDLVLGIEPIEPGNDVTVFIGGAVEEPGLYALPRGSRVAEAIDLAGLRDAADTSSLPLASVLNDEQSIIVPERSTEDSTAESQVSEVDATSQETVDINRASEAELQTLPGIGPALAERIVERRNNDGPFQSLDELTAISGISERIVEDIRDHATVSH
jgi:competence protein ComEA